MCYNHLGPSTKLTSLPGPHFITQEEMRANTRISLFKRIDKRGFSDLGIIQPNLPVISRIYKYVQQYRGYFHGMLVV